MLRLVLHAAAPEMYTSPCCSAGATGAVMASAGKRKGLLVFCSPESPELAELRKLPPGLEVVAIGRTEAELSGETLRPMPFTSVSTQCWATSTEVAVHSLTALCCTGAPNQAGRTCS